MKKASFCASTASNQNFLNSSDPPEASDSLVTNCPRESGAAFGGEASVGAAGVAAGDGGGCGSEPLVTSNPCAAAIA